MQYLSPEYDKSVEAQYSDNYANKYANKQKEKNFDSINEIQAQNIAKLAAMYSFSPPGLTTELGKNYLTVDEAEPWVVAAHNAYANDDRTISNNEKLNTLSAMNIYPWGYDALKNQPKKDYSELTTKGLIKRQVQTFSQIAIAWKQATLDRGLKTIMIASQRAKVKSGIEEDDDSVTKLKAFRNPVFMKEFFNQIKPRYIGGKKDDTRDFVPFFEGGPAYEDAGPSGVGIGFEQYGWDFFDLNKKPEEVGLGDNWFPYFGDGSKVWDETQRRGQQHAKFKGSAFSSTTPAQPVTLGGIIAGQFVDANTEAYKNASGAIDGIAFIRMDLFNKLQGMSAAKKQLWQHFGLLREVFEQGAVTYGKVDRGRAKDVFINSELGKEMAEAWGTALDNTDLLFKTFSPDLALEMTKAGKLKGGKRTQAILDSWDKWILREGMPNMPQGYMWKKTVNNIGMNKILNNLVDPKEKNVARRLWGDWTPNNGTVWADQAGSIEWIRRILKNGRVPAQEADKLLLEFAEATMKNTDKNIGYVDQIKVFDKVTDAIGKTLTDANERPDVVEGYLNIVKGNIKGFGPGDVQSYFRDDILSWENLKATGSWIAREAKFPFQRNKNIGEVPMLISGKSQQQMTPHVMYQMLSEGAQMGDLRNLRRNTSKISKIVRNAEIIAGKKILSKQAGTDGRIIGSYKSISKDLDSLVANSKLMDTPRQAGRLFIDSLWMAQKAAWTPLQLVTRLAFPVRISLEGQARLGADGYPSLINHAVEYFGILLAKNKKNIFKDTIKGTEEFGKITRDLTRNNMGNKAISQLRDDWVDFNFPGLVGDINDPKLKKEYIETLSNEIRILANSPESRFAALDILAGNPSESLAKKMFGGELDWIRQQFNRRIFNEYGTTSNSLNTYEQVVEYAETVFSRVKQATNDTNLLKFIASEDNVLTYVNRQGKKVKTQITNLVNDDGLLNTLKQQEIIKSKSDKELIDYVTQVYDDVAPSVKKAIDDAIANPISGEMPVYKGLPLVQQGPRSLKQKGMNEYKKAVLPLLDGLWESLFAFPAGIERTLVRSPFYRTVLWESKAQAYSLMTDDLKKEFIKEVNSLPKIFSKKLGDEKMVKQGLNKFFNTDSLSKSVRDIINEAIEESKTIKLSGKEQLFDTLEEVNEYANARALLAHNNLLYNLAERGHFADFTRLMFPFMGAFIEVTSNWAKILTRNPFAIRKAGLLVNGAEASGIVYETPEGDKYFQYPWIGPAIESNNFELQNKRIKINAAAPLEALNIVTQGYGPGATPWLQIPAGLSIPDEPEYDTLSKFFNPYGAKATTLEELSEVNKLTYAVPAYWVKISTALSEGKGIFGDEDLWNRHVIDTMKALAATGNYVDEVTGKLDQKALEEAALQIGKDTLLVRAAYQFGLPAGYTYDYRLLTDIESKELSKEYFGEDVKLSIDSENYLRFSAVTALYANVKQVVNNDDAAAILMMTEILGPSWLDSVEGFTSLNYLTKGRTYNKAGIRSTTEQGFDWERENIFLEEYVGKILGLFAPPPEPGADFSFESWFNQHRKGDLVQITPEEFHEAVNQINGSRMWRIRTAIGGNNLTVKEKARIKADIDELFPNWYARTIDISADEENWKQAELSVGISGYLPSRAVVAIKDSELYEPLKIYMDARENALKAIGRKKGIERKYGATNSQRYYLMNTAGTDGVRSMLRDLGNDLAEESESFAIFWLQLGLREVENEYYETPGGEIRSVFEDRDN